MERAEIIRLNQKLWDQIAPQFVAGTALPKYGPFIPNEEDLKLLDGMKGKKVLELGCGSGHSLYYLKKTLHAEELWGVDISNEQIQIAQDLFNKEGLSIKLCTGSMDDDLGIPKSHFDYVISIYALGWTPDLSRTLSLIYDYLKPGGVFVFSWEHPVYKCLSYDKEIDSFVFLQSYHEEGPRRVYSMKGIEGLDHVKHPRSLSTYINSIVHVGLIIDQLIEPNIDLKMAREVDFNPEKYFSIPRAKLVPTTFIIKARKPV